jgi:hypothetical protein
VCPAHTLVDAVGADWNLPRRLVRDIHQVVDALLADAAGTRSTLMLSLDDTGLRVALRDFDTRLPPPRPGGADPHGLALVGHLTVDHTIFTRSDGKHVSALLPHRQNHFHTVAHARDDKQPGRAVNDGVSSEVSRRHAGSPAESRCR